MILRRAALCSVIGACFATLSLAQQQPRDVRRGTTAADASITGVVLTEGARPQPLRRVRVTLNNTGRTLGQTAITNDKGEFSFSGLPAGRYLVSGVKDGFVTMHHGARRPNRPGASIPLAAAEKKHLTLRLPAGSVITGTVTDPDGLPAPGIRVQALAHRLVGGSDRRLVPIVNQLGWLTDDRGEYRIFGLPPGDYIIAARPSGSANTDLQVLSRAEVRRALSEAASSSTNTYAQPGPVRAPAASPLPAEPRRGIALAPVMYPGTTSTAHAASVTLGSGEHRAGIDIQLQHVGVARVEGLVFSPGGPAGRVMVSLFLPGAQAGSSLPLEHFRTASANAQGAFAFAGVPPGHYTVVARTVPQPSRTDQWASTEIVLDGDDVAGVVLSLRDGLTMSGRITFDSEHPPALDLSGLRLQLPMAMAATTPMPMPRAALAVNTDGGFTVSGIVPSLYAMTDGRGVRWPIGSWWLKSMISGGRDLLDAPLLLKQGADDVVLTLTDRVSEISGTVTDAGHPSPDGYVVVFSVDRSAWFPGSRRVAGARPSDAGRYRFRNLPPGDYLLIADDDIEDAEWNDPALLARLSSRAARVTIGAEQKAEFDLELPARQ